MFTLHVEKIVKAVAMTLLHIKENYFLFEFITSLKHALDIALPSYL
jgi:hypothetical protein